ncbi:hypothetical protein N9K78_03800 [Aquiluna sp.]|nr:hypothetical protein [Aquiluna sp.]
MEILVVIAYAAILALVAPFVFPPSEHYGKLVPAGIALVSGAGAWLTLTWLGFHYDEAWIWFIVMIAMPLAAWFGTRAIEETRKKQEEAELEAIRAAARR